MYSKERAEKISRLLSFVLRHKPDTIGLTLDPNGWAHIEDLIEKLNAHHSTELTRDLLQTVVESNDKQRFKISDDGQRIRASQGHSIDVDLVLAAREPPDRLFHGTALRFLAEIRREGLKPMSRQHVHLSRDETTALRVGSRHGQAVVIAVNARQMYLDGLSFFLSDNGVWLTEVVHPKYFAGESGSNPAQASMPSGE